MFGRISENICFTLLIFWKATEFLFNFFSTYKIVYTFIVWVLVDCVKELVRFIEIIKFVDTQLFVVFFLFIYHLRHE